MQNLMNPTTPLFDSDGKVLAGARVTFLSTDTSGTLIELYASDGTTRIANPLYTGSDGRLTDGNTAQVPYVKDGVGYKVTVERSTGVQPITDSDGTVVNESECWEDPFVWIVVPMTKADDSVINTNIVEGIAGVRNASKALKVVICEGYSTANDGCPARTFRWVESVNPLKDNAFNVLRIADDSTGYWKMDDPSGCVDVRMGGVFPGYTDSSTLFANILQNLNNTLVDTVYFPQGNYRFGSNHAVGSMVLEKDACIYPYDSTTVTFTIGRLENRGGKFEYDSDTLGRVIPKLGGGIFRTSWLDGLLSAFVYSGSAYTGIFDSVEAVVYDSDITYGTAPATFSVDCIAIDTVGYGIPTYMSHRFAFNANNRKFVASQVNVGDTYYNSGNIAHALDEGSAIMIQWDSEGQNVKLYDKTSVANLTASNITTSTLSSKALHIEQDAKHYYKTDTDLYGLIESAESEYSIGDIVTVESTLDSDGQTYVYVGYKYVDSVYKKVRCVMNHGVVLQFICTGLIYNEHSSEREFLGHEWAPMSNISKSVVEA